MNYINLATTDDIDLIEKILTWVEEKRKKMTWWQRILFDSALKGLQQLLLELRNRIFASLKNTSVKLYGDNVTEILNMQMNRLEQVIEDIRDDYDEKVDTEMILRYLYTSDFKMHDSAPETYAEWRENMKQEVADQLPF